MKLNNLHLHRKGKSRFTLFDGGAALALLFLALLFLHRGEVQYSWRWELFRNMFLLPAEGGWETGLFLKGFFLSVKLTVCGFLVALVLGIPVGVARTLRLYPLRVAAKIYVESLRNIPPIVTVFIVTYFFTGPFFNSLSFPSSESAAGEILNFLFMTPSRMPLFLSGIISLGLYEGAYVAEIIRGGIEAIPSGQTEAARALGLPSTVLYRKILLPQVFRNTLPPMTSQIISTLKDSSILSVIALPELTMRGSDIQKVTSQPFEAWLITASIYFFMAFGISRLLETVYRRRLTQYGL